jgi:hypothetical protein
MKIKSNNFLHLSVTMVDFVGECHVLCIRVNNTTTENMLKRITYSLIGYYCYTPTRARKWYSLLYFIIASKRYVVRSCCNSNGKQIPVW